MMKMMMSLNRIHDDDDDDDDSCRSDLWECGKALGDTLDSCAFVLSSFHCSMKFTLECIAKHNAVRCTMYTEQNIVQHCKMYIVLHRMYCITKCSAVNTRV